VAFLEGLCVVLFAAGTVVWAVCIVWDLVKGYLDWWHGRY
jgi:hypothetical protein